MYVYSLHATPCTASSSIGTQTHRSAKHKALTACHCILTVPRSLQQDVAGLRSKCWRMWAQRACMSRSRRSYRGASQWRKDGLHGLAVLPLHERVRAADVPHLPDQTKARAHKRKSEESVTK